MRDYLFNLLSICPHFEMLICGFGFSWIFIFIILLICSDRYIFFKCLELKLQIIDYIFITKFSQCMKEVQNRRNFIKITRNLSNCDSSRKVFKYDSGRTDRLTKGLFIQKQNPEEAIFRKITFDNWPNTWNVSTRPIYHPHWRRNKNL